MTTFFTFGNYTPESIKDISLTRTEKAVEAIKQLGGEVRGMYALLGEYDLLFCVELPDVEAATKASISLAKLTGIAFHTCPAMKVEVFDRLVCK